jgi:signal transduction histidine kinase
VQIDGVPVRVRVQPFHRADRDGFVVAAQPVRRRASDLRGIVGLLIVSSIVTLIAAGFAIWLVTRRALRPLRELTQTADEVGRSPDRTRRLPPPQRNDDLGRVTGSFNAMLDRLEQAHRRTALMLAAQQRFTADASHELRTPLTTIRANAGFLRANPQATEADRAEALGDIEAESARMSRLVDDLLTLARADGGALLAPVPVDVGQLAHDVCRRAAAQHPDRDIHCSGPPSPLRADADALSQLLWILLDNAVRHTTTGDKIWVAVTAPAPGRAIVQVADAGEGIPAGQERRIFDRFHQADPARRHGGAGLGLSIAAWIAAAHRGTITAANNERGGATFTVGLSSLS